MFASNLMMNRGNFSSSVFIPMDTGGEKDHAITILQGNWNSLSIPDHDTISANHRSDEDQSTCHLAGRNSDGQSNGRSEVLNFSKPEQVRKRSSESQCQSKWKLGVNIIPRITCDKFSGNGSANMNRITHLNSKLLDAIKNLDNDNVESLLKSGADPNATCRESHISACHAAAYFNSEALRVLLRHGARRDRRDKFGRTPLHLAAWSGRNCTTAMLLDFTDDLQNKVMFEVTPEAEEEIKVLRLELASAIDVPCEQTNDAVLELWKDSIEHQCERYMVLLPKFVSGWSPLHIASYAAHHDTTRLLLAAGANPNSKDAMGRTPLDIAGGFCYIDLTRFNVDGYVKTIKTLIEFGGRLNVSVTTPSNSALHTAVELCSVEAMQELLAAGAPIGQQNSRGNTALHECVVKRCIEPLQVLVKYDQSVDVVNSSGYTVLHASIFASWLPGVRIALDAGADPTFQAHDGITAIHIAALKGDTDILKEILRYVTRNGIDFERDNNRVEAPICYAVRSGNIECVKAFLEAGASLKMTYFAKQMSEDVVTPVFEDFFPSQVGSSKMILHTTAKHGSVDMLKLILNHDRSLERLLCYECPYSGAMIPVEFAAFHNRLDSFRFLLQKTLERKQNLKETFDHSRLLKIVRNKEKLFEELMIQIPNAVGTTGLKDYPLHDAARNRDRDLIVRLIDNGADLSEVSKNGNTAISLIIDHISKPTEFLSKIFDNYITTNKTTTECEIKVDYRALIPTTDDKLEKNNQMRVVTALLRTKDHENQRKLLAHPLIESFLYLKWKTLCSYFYLMVCLYFLFVMSLSLHTVSFFYYRDKFNKTMIEQGIIPRIWNSTMWQYIIYFTLGIVVFQELSYSSLAPKTWSIKNLSVEFWVKCIAYSLAIATTLVISFECEIIPGQVDWPRHLSTLTLFMAWLNIIMMISKIPMSGYYIEMFWMVLSKVIEIFVTFSCLILMFSLCFMIQFHSQAPFEGPWAALAKTLVMMTSEFDYDDSFAREKAVNLSTPIQLLRVVFVIFMIVTAIVLMNLMIGVAVDDITNLVKNGQLKRLEKQVAFLDRLEVSRRSKKSTFHFLGLHRWFKYKHVPQTESFIPVNNHKCRYSVRIKEAIMKKVQERLDRIERETESIKIETKLERLIQDVWKKLESKFEMLSQSLSNRQESMLVANAETIFQDNNVSSQISQLMSRMEYIQNSLDKLNDHTNKN